MRCPTDSVQLLEPRRHLAYSLDDGVLTFTGEPVAIVTRSLTPGRLDVLATSKSTYGKFLLRKVREIRMTGTAADDILYVLDQRGPIPAKAFVSGLGGDDEIDVGGAIESDVLAGAGDDDVRGSGGADTLNGGPGDDDLTGAAGNDLLLGGRGADRLDGKAGRDRLVGGSDDDYLNGSDAPRKGGRDTLVGNAGEDDLTGDKFGNDVLFEDEEVL